MINTQFHLIDKATIESLISNAAPESRTLDYKETLPGGTTSDRKEFLADVSSFANASGGDIIYGVSEKRDENKKATGIPDSALGLEGVNADAEILRLENMLRDGIDPRIPVVQIKHIDGFPKGAVIIIHIPKSWSSPHMVNVSSSRFFSRNNRGKYSWDVREIRAAFGMSESLTERIRRFRDDRISKIIAEETPLPILANPKVLLHLLPLSAFDTSISINISDTPQLLAKMSPLGSGGFTHRHNLDGLLVYVNSPERVCYSYVQLFRNGAIEAVDAFMMDDRNGVKSIPSVYFEKEIVKGLRQFLEAQISVGSQMPVIVMLTLINVKGYRMAVDPRFMSSGSTIDRDILILPEVMVEDTTQPPEQILRPIFDALWQAADWRGSLNYDKDNKWTLHG